MRYILLFLFLFIPSISLAEIPIIVISAGKSYQSKSIVGSNIEVLDNNTISSSNEPLLGDLINDNVVGSNFSRQGTTGTNTLIQIRGLPKRYTTVYVDGVKMSDPSTPDNAYYLNNIMSHSIERVEILKGSQSSLYGSGAIGGTVNIFTKKPSSKNLRKNLFISSGSNKSRNLSFELDKQFKNHEYYIGLNKFKTDGVSAMRDNTESDGYENNGVSANYNYQFSDIYRLENNLRYVDSFLNYDQAGTTDDKNTTDDKEISYSVKLISDTSKIKNQFIFNKTYFKRIVGNNTATSKSNYYGYRDAINFNSEYNIDSDTRIVFGLENEFDAADFDTWATSSNKKTDEAIYSQYFDYQFRPLEKLYATFGARMDNRTTAGEFKTGRVTLAYKPDNFTKFRTNVGTGIRFATLNDYFYDNNVKEKEVVTPEKSYNLDFGIDKKFPDKKIDLSLNFFYMEYDDNITNWSTNTQSGSSYTIANSGGKIISKGFDVSTKYKFSENLNFKFSYALTNAYDGEDCDNPSGSCIDEMPVRVPRHNLSGAISKKINNLSLTFLGKYNSERRDYGNSDNGFKDVILDDFSVFDLKFGYNLFNKYDLFFNVKNIFDKNYEDAYQYSTLGRDLNIGLKHKF